MSFEAKDDSGNLFKIDPNEVKSDKHPTYEGEYNVRCPHCGKTQLGWVKGWIREAKTGAKYFSLAFKHRQKRDAP